MTKKSYKTRCLEAVDILIDEYQNQIHRVGENTCSLCMIYFNNINSAPNYCLGCPNTAFIVRKKWKNYKIVPCLLRSLSISNCLRLEISHLHRDFWLSARHALEALPDNSFIPSKSKPEDFKVLLDIDLNVYKDYITE